MVPYWSDQFGLKIQLFGRPEHADGLLPLHGDGLAGRAVRGTVVAARASRPAAVAGFGAARFTVRHRALLQAGADRGAALEQAAMLSSRGAAPPPPPARQRRVGATPPGRGSRPRDEAVLDPGIGEPLLHGGAALVHEPLGVGTLAEHVEALGERVPRLLDLALDGVRVARHGAS
jgi:hypothetical protein